MTKDFTNDEAEIYNNQLEAKSIEVGVVKDTNAITEYTKKQLETEIEKYNNKIKDLTHEIDKLTSIRDAYAEIRNDLENLRMNITKG